MKLMIILLIGLCIIEFNRITNLENTVQSILDELEFQNERIKRILNNREDTQ